MPAIINMFVFNPRYLFMLLTIFGSFYNTGEGSRGSRGQVKEKAFIFLLESSGPSFLLSNVYPEIRYFVGVQGRFKF
jgi:hypothetical protein